MHPDESSKFGLVLYSFQWLAFNIIALTMSPLVVGIALGLNGLELADFLQRTILICAVGSLLQLWFGHRLTICENPSGVWVTVFMTLAALTAQTSGNMATLRAQLEMGVMLAGLLLVVCSMAGLFNRIFKLFTPAITGTVLILTALQLSGTIVKGMTGIENANSSFDIRALIVSITVVLVIILISLKAKGFWRGISVLIGAVAGCIIASCLGIAEDNAIAATALIRIPSLFPWGAPKFDFGIITVSMMTALLVIPSFMTAISAMQQSLGITVKQDQFMSGLRVTGLMNILAGIYGTFGFYATVSSASLVNLTGVKRKAPFLTFAVILLVLGCFVPVVQFLIKIPVPVRYAVMLVSFTQMLGFGLADLFRTSMDKRQVFVIGIPVLISVGIGSLPMQSLKDIPEYARLILGNGFLMGMLLCILLEHLIIPQTRYNKAVQLQATI